VSVGLYWDCSTQLILGWGRARFLRKLLISAPSRVERGLMTENQNFAALGSKLTKPKTKPPRLSRG
jgi:hypothetical protein